MSQEDQIASLQEKIPFAATATIDDLNALVTGPAREANSTSLSVGFLSHRGSFPLAADPSSGSVFIMNAKQPPFLRLDLAAGTLFSTLSPLPGNRRILHRFGSKFVDLTSNIQKGGVLWTVSPFAGSPDELRLTTGDAPMNSLGTNGSALFTDDFGSPWTWSGEHPPPPPAPSFVVTAEAFWWGFHFRVPSQQMDDWVSGGVTFAKVLDVVAGITGPAAPFVQAFAKYIELEFQLARAVDQGKGVFVSMTWFAPGIFAPTPIT